MDCGGTCWLHTLHANSTPSPQMCDQTCLHTQPSVPAGEGPTALAKIHCCHLAAQELALNRSESPDPVSATHSVTQSLCQVRTAQRSSNLGLLQCAATETLCCLRPHVTYQSVSPRLAVTHSPVTEVCAAHFLVVSVPLCQPPRVSGSQGLRALHKDKAQNTRGVGETKTQRHHTRPGGQRSPRNRETHRDRDAEKPDPTGPQLVMLHGSLKTCRGPPPLTSALDLGVRRLEVRG